MTKVKSRLNLWVLLLVLAGSCVPITQAPVRQASNTNSGVRIKFYNRTGYGIDSLIVNQTYVGHLAKDSSSVYVAFPGLGFDTGMPMANVEAYLNGKKIITQHGLGRCGTQVSGPPSDQLELALVHEQYRETRQVRLLSILAYEEYLLNKGR